ncbi:MAG: helix-turn-helix domain-containing protein [Rubrivivax sp.]|nr:helix-turn-helix domain-containing protein [Rubrivivax sp.]
MTTSSDASERRGIQSVDRGLALLAAMAAAPGPAPLSALAAAAGMAAPNAHRFLASFVRAGLAVQDAATARYDLGPLALRIGLAALQRADPIAAVQRALPALVAEVGVTAIVVVWSERGPTIVHWQRSTPAFASALALGSLLPATGSASGRVLLAGMDERVAAREIAAPPRRGRAARGGRRGRARAGRRLGRRQRHRDPRPGRAGGAAARRAGRGAGGRHADRPGDRRRRLAGAAGAAAAGLLPRAGARGGARYFVRMSLPSEVLRSR